MYTRNGGDDWKCHIGCITSHPCQSHKFILDNEVYDGFHSPLVIVYGTYRETSKGWRFT